MTGIWKAPKAKKAAHAPSPQTPHTAGERPTHGAPRRLRSWLMYCWPCSAWWSRIGNNQAGTLAYLQPREFNQALTRKGTADQPGQAHLAWAFFLLVHRGHKHVHSPLHPRRCRKAVYAVDTGGAAADPPCTNRGRRPPRPAVTCLIDAASVPLAVTNTACRSYLYCISYLY